MAKKKWKPAINFILIVIVGNFSKAMRFSLQFFNQLTKASQNDAFYTPLLTAYTPVHQALLNIEATKVADIGIQAGSTLSLEQLLKKLASPKYVGVTKLNEWDLIIQGIYDKTTAQYKALFAGGHASFTIGRIDKRIARINSLITTCGTDAALATVKADIQTFYTLIATARTTQGTNKGQVKTNVSTETAAIAAAATLGFSQYGLIVSHTPDDENNIEKFFDMTVFQKENTPKLINVTIGAGKHKKIATRKWKVGQQIKITINTGPALTFYLTDKVKNNVNAVGVTIPNTGSTTVLVSNLGASLTLKMLMIRNTDPNVTGEAEVEFL